jgi:Ca-activated chloride channel family protein
MSEDDFDRLTRALRNPPAPARAARDAALRLAMENFDRLQGSRDAVRPSSEGQGGLWTGVHRMINFLTSRQALAATTSVAALCIGVVLIQPQLRSGVTGGVEAIPQVPATAPAKPAQPRADADDGLARPVEEQRAEAPLRDQALADALPEPAPAGNAPLATTLPPPPPAPAPMPEMLAEAAPPATTVSPGRTAGKVERKRAVLNGGDAEADMGAAGGASGEGMVVGGLVAPAPSAAPEMLGYVAPSDIVAQPAEPDTEAFPEAAQNPVKVTAEEPVSTFSIDVDTASYAIVRSSLMGGYLPAPEEVRIEEMVNYFPYDLPAPEAGEAPFKATVTVMPAPWNDGRRLVQVALQGRLPALADRPPLNLVFLVDTSGSMDEPNKLPLLKQSLGLVLPQLREGDQVAIVAYAGSAGVVLPSTEAGESRTILSSLDRLAAGGSTAGAEGLELAYQVAEDMTGAGEVSRILLATDGDFNVGVSDPEGLEAYIAKKRETGTYLSVLGFGRGNLDDATMQAIAQAGNGTAAYIDTLQEARKVLVDQLSGALFPIADDVKIQVEWNPATVAEYRLIGYETRALAREDFNNDRVDAGEIGAGHAVTAIYEITAPGSPALSVNPLRYGNAEAAPATGSDELGFLRLRWKAPGENTSALVEVPITPDMAPVGDEARFAAAIAGFGQLLTGGTYLGNWGWDEAIALALSGRGEDQFGYRNEAVGLMRLAKALSEQ